MKTLTKASRDIAVLTSQDVAELAVRLEVDDYTDPFEGLNDWHLLRSLAFQRPEWLNLISTFWIWKPTTKHRLKNLAQKFRRN
jgi:Protein of unknown function (DUF2555).